MTDLRQSPKLLAECYEASHVPKQARGDFDVTSICDLIPFDLPLVEFARWMLEPSPVLLIKSQDEAKRTLLAGRLMKWWIDHQLQFEGDDLRFFCHDAVLSMQEYHQAVNDRNQRSNFDNVIKYTNYLTLLDVQSVPKSEQELLYALLRHRRNEGKMTVVTSDLIKLADLNTDLLAHISSGHRVQV